MVTVLRPKKFRRRVRRSCPRRRRRRRVPGVEARHARRRGGRQWRLTWPDDCRPDIRRRRRRRPTSTARRTTGELAQVEGLVAAGRFDDALASARAVAERGASAPATRGVLLAGDGRGSAGANGRDRPTPNVTPGVRDWRSCGSRSIIRHTRWRRRAFSVRGSFAAEPAGTDLAANLWSELVPDIPGRSGLGASGPAGRWPRLPRSRQRRRRGRNDESFGDVMRGLRLIPDAMAESGDSDDVRQTMNAELMNSWRNVVDPAAGGRAGCR